MFCVFFFFFFFLMLVRSAGHIIWGLWPEIFEEIWKGNLLQSGSVGDHSSATRRRAATQDAARSFLRSRLLMSCVRGSECFIGPGKRLDKQTAAIDSFFPGSAATLLRREMRTQLKLCTFKYQNDFCLSYCFTLALHKSTFHFPKKCFIHFIQLV